jgi:subtilase family serine protease
MITVGKDCQTSMSYQVRNSNQFISWLPGTFLTPADYLQGQIGSKLPDTQDASLTDKTEITTRFILRRNNFEASKKPKGFIDANDVQNLSYQEQIAYINKLSSKKIRDWYGASAEDIEAVTSYLISNNATIIASDQEKRTVTAKLTLGDFKSGFLASNTDAIFSAGQEDNLYYYNPKNYADSYLKTEGSDGEAFAEAVIGNRVYLGDRNNTNDAKTTSERNQGVINKEAENREEESQKNVLTKGNDPDFLYYPREIGKLYSFPDESKTGGGKNVGIGIVGTGGEQLEKYLSINNTLNNYLKAQEINTEKIGRLFTGNKTSSQDEEWGEVTLDFSVTRSLAPRSDIYISQNAGGSTLYDSFAELVYNKRIDVITSAAAYDRVPGTFNETESLNELYIDAMLRGKTFITSAGDVGTSNNKVLIPRGLPIAGPEQGTAVLSVGGTAFNRSAQELIWPRGQVTQPTAFPPSFSTKTLDELTGLMSEQYVWNQNKISVLKEEDRLNSLIYPTVSNQFTIEDFIGSQVFADPQKPSGVGLFANSVASSGVQDSSILPMPAYQSKNLSKRWLGTGRRYPDVSALAANNAENGSQSYYYSLNIKPKSDNTDFIPEVHLTGGTSAASPLIAGLVANLTSYIRKRFGKKQKLGMINPLLYESYNSENRGKTFLDIPAGTNNANLFSIATSPDDWSGYTGIYQDPETKQTYLIPLNGTGPGGQLDTNLSSTGQGFDAATGLGSINGEGLLDQLVSVFSQL